MTNGTIPPIEVEYRTQKAPFQVISDTFRFDKVDRRRKEDSPIYLEDLPVTHIIDVYDSIDDGKSKGGSGVYVFRYRYVHLDDDEYFFKESKYLVFDPENPFRYEYPIPMRSSREFMAEVSEKVKRSRNNKVVVAGTRRELWIYDKGDRSGYYDFHTAPFPENMRYRTIRVCFDSVRGTILKRGSEITGADMRKLMKTIKTGHPDEKFLTADLGEWTEFEVMVDSKEMSTKAFTVTLPPRVDFAEKLIEDFIHYLDLTRGDLTDVPYPSMIRNASLRKTK
ncbi:MAG: hypothetical protein HY831_04255 [Candidatus Aenigmarchaeota archaeon]|nr:hypothetical protein [Candidatus Aenigmarchaeota archaeon]